MIVNSLKILINLAICVAAMIGYAPAGHAMDRVPVFVSIVPQKYFVQQIGKNLVDVRVMVKPGASPATYEPKPRQMADLSGTKLYFAIGVPFEKVWLEKIAAANPDMQVVHTDHGIKKIPMTAPDHHHEAGGRHKQGEDHGEGGHHHGEGLDDRGGLDPHLWLAPPLVKVQANTILAALEEVDPAHRTVYRQNHKDFIARIDALDAQLKRIFSGKQGLQFMVFHPAWGYFARSYGIEQVPIEIEGKHPKPAQLQALIEHAREKDIKVIFVQPQFSTKSAELVALAIGGQVAFADPLAEDWMANMGRVAQKFEAALR